MKSECLIVTGSSGLIGSAFIDRVGERFQEFGFDRQGPPHPPPATEHVIDCDLASEESIQHALATTRRLGGQRIASVVHLAAYYDFSGEPSPLYEQITVRGTERLLRGLRDFSVEQFVFASTMLVHVPCQPGQRKALCLGFWFGPGVTWFCCRPWEFCGRLPAIQCDATF